MGGRAATGGGRVSARVRSSQGVLLVSWVWAAITEGAGSVMRVPSTRTGDPHSL